jgi:hypothetical protein
MTVKFIKVLTREGYITLNRTTIVSIDPTENGSRIMLLPHPQSENPVTIESIEQYEDILETYFTG